jgi:hypothetical protein
MMTQNQAMIELDEQDLEQVNGASGGYYPYPKEVRYNERHLEVHHQTPHFEFNYELNTSYYIVKY